jgi:predicted CXXCH cytochrome family protein
MKFKKVVLLGSILIGLTTISFGQNIRGSRHDFTTASNAAYNSTGELCIVCHAPHGTDATAVPLWNHAVTTQTFQTYIGYKFSNAGMGGSTITQPDGASKLCLSCHDGVSAMNQFGSYGNPRSTYQGTNSPLPMTTNDRLGTDLTNDHPISFVYNTALATNDGTLKDPATATTSLGGTIATDLLDINGKVQCPSCHEVHDQTIYRFGKMSNAGSALCLTCHNK